MGAYKGNVGCYGGWVKRVLALATVGMLLAPAASYAEATTEPGTTTGPPATKGPPAAPKVEVLSNLKSLTRWAYPTAAAEARSKPNKHSQVVGHLSFLTSEGHSEVYLALRRDTVEEDAWIEVPLPGRPNGRTGWVPEHVLGELHVLHSYLRVNRETDRVTLYRNGKRIYSALVGTGRPELPTPKGQFYIREKFPVIGDPFYGPFAMGTSAYAPTLSLWPGGGVVGIHGTDEPQLIPGHPSHGCIRLKDEDIVKLYHLVEVGTPVEIV